MRGTWISISNRKVGGGRGNRDVLSAISGRNACNDNRHFDLGLLGVRVDLGVAWLGGTDVGRLAGRLRLPGHSPDFQAIGENLGGTAGC